MTVYRTIHVSLVLCGLMLSMASRPAWANESSEYSKLLASVGPAFVTIKFVLKMEGQFGNRESEAEVTGIMVDPEGIVLCGNTRFGSPRMMRSYGGSATPTDVKVLIGDDTDGLEARVLARDSELDLAWVQIKKPGDRKFIALDLANSAVPEVGQRIFSMRKMAKYFDRILTIGDGRISGKTRKPRELFVPNGAGNLEPGLPVFAESGKIIGIVVIQMPEDEELQGMAFTGIGRDISNGLILPCPDVLKATTRAKEVGQKDDSDEDEADARKGESSSGVTTKPVKPSVETDVESDEE